MKGLSLYRVSKWLFAIVLGGLSVASGYAEGCPDRPSSGTVVADPFSISSQNGALNARFTLGHSVDAGGYTHYCYRYQAGNQVIEAPTLRVNPGDVLNLNVVNGVTDGDSTKMRWQRRQVRSAAIAERRRLVRQTCIFTE